MLAKNGLKNTWDLIGGIMDKFVNLHAHTSYSDGIGSLNAMMNKVKDLGQNALAITDHGTLSGAMAFMRTAKENDIKPIVGIEGYMINDTLDIYFHITLLAMNKNGFENLVKLNNVAHKSLYKKPAFTLEQLVRFSDDVIVLSGCPDGVPVKGSPSFIAEFGLTLKKVFGNRFYAEIMFSMPDIWKKQLKFADTYELPIVFTADSHFINKGDHGLHSKVNKLLRGYTFPNKPLFLHSRTQMESRANSNKFPFHRIQEGLNNTVKIASMVEEFVIEHPVTLPAPPDAKQQLYNVIQMKKNRMIMNGVWNDEYAARLKYESNIITRMKFWDYFWMVWKVVEHGKSQNIKLGHGRGSAAGSLVVYMLGITTVDPVKYDLIFERFLNIARKGVVDIDLDWQADRRDEIIEFAHVTWKALPLITISTYSHKSLLNDLARVFKINSKQKAELSDEHSPEFALFCTSNPEFAHAYKMMIGGVRHRGKHASGFAITKNHNLPVERMKGNKLTYGVPLASSQYDDLTPWGATKFDLLGLTSLSALSRMEELT